MLFFKSSAITGTTDMLMPVPNARVGKRDCPIGEMGVWFGPLKARRAWRQSGGSRKRFRMLVRQGGNLVKGALFDKNGVNKGPELDRTCK